MKDKPIYVASYIDLTEGRKETKALRRYGRHVNRQNRKARMWRFWNQVLGIFS